MITCDWLVSYDVTLLEMERASQILINTETEFSIFILNIDLLEAMYL
jgi:hypothetical protein